MAALALLAALTGGRALAAQTIPPCASWVHQPQLDLDIPDAWPVPVGHPLGARAVMRDSVGCPDTTVAIRWFSTDTSLVRPVPTGRNTMTSECKAPGVVTITAVREPFLARARIVCGPWQVERIELVPAGARLGVGDTLRITAIPRTATGQSLPAYWVFWRWDPIDAFTLGRSRHPEVGTVELVARRAVRATVNVEQQQIRGQIPVVIGEGRPPPRVARLDFTPDTVLEHWGQETLTAIPRDASGAPLPRLVRWRVQDTSAIARWGDQPLTPWPGHLQVEGRKPGRWWVQADAGGVVVRHWFIVRGQERAMAALRDTSGAVARGRVLRALGLAPLERARRRRGVREVRLWSDLALGEPSSLYRVVDSAGRVTGKLYYTWHADRTAAWNLHGVREVPWSDLMRYDLDGVCGAIHSTATVEACEVRFAAPPPWAKFLAELDRHQVWRLPDQSQLPADSMMVLDGWGFTAEVRNPAGYRRYRYDNPEAHRAPEAQDAGAIGRSLRLINGLVAPNVHRRTYRGLSVSAPGVQGFRPCDSTQVWEAGGDFRPISRLRPGYDTLALPVESLYVEVRGMLAAPGLAAQWRSRYPEVLDIDSVLHQEPWRNGRCAWGPAD